MCLEYNLRLRLICVETADPQISLAARAPDPAISKINLGSQCCQGVNKNIIIGQATFINTEPSALT
nr:hypothetical protein [Candidatus Njordarchaeota archaeon]